MDVGDPSNMERLRDLFPDFAELRKAVEAYPVDDDSIRAQIRKDYARYGRAWCPHTATGFFVYDQLPAGRKAGHAWIVEATAHPAKFDTIVEPVIGADVPVPAALAALLRRPVASNPLPPVLASLAEELDNWHDLQLATTRR
jgi:threonine synthase